MMKLSLTSAGGGGGGGGGGRGCGLAASEFLSLEGTAIVTTEAAGHPIWDIAYDSATGFFDVTQIGTVSYDPEAAFFVTGPSVPEPSTWAMLLLGFTGLGFVGYRQTRRAMPQAASLTA